MKVKDKALLGQVGDMDLRLLRVFKAVADCGGMAAAELELNIGMSTVSRHVKDLETRLGLTLCRRGRGGFALTAEGERVYNETVRLLFSVDAFRGSIDEIHRRLGGQLEVGLFDKTATNPASRIGEAISRFTELAPDVKLNIHIGSIAAIERGLIAGSFHVGVIPEHRASAAFEYSPLFAEQMLLYCGRGHPLFHATAPLTWEKLRGHALAGLGFHSPNMQLAHRAQLVRAATGYDQEAIATLLLSGKFIGFLPDHYAEQFVQRGQLRSVQPSTFKYGCTFTALVRRSPAPSRATELFFHCLKQVHSAEASL